MFGAPRRGGDGEYLITAYVPHFQDGTLARMTVGVVPLNALLRDVVPWWYAERYQLRVLDIGGNVLAARSKVAVPGTAASHRIVFDPPGHGLVLESTPYRSQTNLVRNGLAVGIVLLMLLVLWSVRRLRHHGRGRQAAEDALREQYAFRKAMEDSLQTGLRARDLQGRITYVNPAFCRMVGWNADELIGRGPPMPYWVDEEMEATRALNEAILAGQGPKQGFEIRFRRGTARPSGR